jgi:hypothetical protein
MTLNKFFLWIHKTKKLRFLSCKEKQEIKHTFFIFSFRVSLILEENQSVLSCRTQKKKNKCCKKIKYVKHSLIKQYKQNNFSLKFIWQVLLKYSRDKEIQQ